MTFIRKVFIMLLIFISVNEINAQINNQKVEKIKIYGNCNMCKESIENAGSETNVSSITWDAGTKIAIITYDDTKTSLNTILKKIAKAGYSNERYKAKNSDYKKLPVCCQY
jgi:periplasmic mercuric ion binding protein